LRASGSTRTTSITPSRASSGRSGDDALDATLDAPANPPAEAGPDANDGGTTVADADTACPGPCAGTVFNGRCILPLATGRNGPHAIATDGAYVYWVEKGSVRRVPSCGGTQDILGSNTALINFIAVDDNRVYWTQGTTVQAMTKSTGVVAPIATAQGNPAGIAVNATNVYWANVAADGGIMRAPLDGGPPVTVVPYLGNPEFLVLSPTTVYWVQYAGARVWEAPLMGGTQKLFYYDTNTDIAGLGIDSNNIYYTEQSFLGPVGVVPLDGGAATAIAHDNGTFGVVSDGTYVYYSAPNGDAPAYDGAVLRVPVDGGTPTTLATGGMPDAIAIDATSIYWTSSVNGTVTKLSPR
jgi:hypothetical protein